MRKYTRKLIQEAVKKSSNWSDVCRNLGAKPIGSMHTHIKNQAIKFNIDYSHFRKYKPPQSPKKLPLNSYLKRNSKISAHRLRLKLIREKVKDEKCEICLLSVWQNKNIPLELHHIDGDRKNNLLENLQILCKNCHAQTENYGVPKGKGRNQYRDCPKCLGKMHRNSKQCRKCRHIEQKQHLGS